MNEYDTLRIVTDCLKWTLYLVIETTSFYVLWKFEFKVDLASQIDKEGNVKILGLDPNRDVVFKVTLKD